MGPRPQPRVPNPASIAVGPDPVAWVAARETGKADLRPGCEARIVWADPSAPGQRTARSVVYLHGFSATRQETAPFSVELARALGANLFEARLTGHGRSEDAMGEATAQDWLRDGAQALEVGRRLGEQVVVVACSTGGTLATVLLAADHAYREGVEALVMISPNYGVHDDRSRILTWPWGAQLARVLVGEYRSFTPINEEQAAYWTTRYPTGVLVEMMALVDLADEADLANLTTPTLVVTAAGDRVIDPQKVAARYPRLGAERKELVWFEGAEDPAQHVLAGRILSPSGVAPLTSEVVSFLGLR
jgi:alpha-beta hydrolase superfamily lysophospholipase